MKKGDQGFEPRGLPGYRVFFDARFGYWWYTRPENVPHTFAWDEATQDHTTPVYCDWPEGRRSTARGAVAAAHHHDQWVREKMAALAKAEGRSAQ